LSISGSRKTRRNAVELLLDQTYEERMNHSDVVALFAARWDQAKKSGCTAVLFEEDKWPLIDAVLEEALKTQSLRRELVVARVELKALEGALREEVARESLSHKAGPKGRTPLCHEPS